ncbi:MAG TPA: FtsX-like permease family protein [Luteibaculaceae bacterium]|nr:FtsX-like permease family protein [Luteibaculaceae bacterium]
MKQAWSIARTHLLAKPKQTLVAMLGVTFGIGMFIALVSLMSGLNQFTEEVSMTSSPDIRLYMDPTIQPPPLVASEYPQALVQVDHVRPATKRINLKDGLQTIAQLMAREGVKGVAPLVSSQVFFNYGAMQLNGVVMGIDVEQEERLFNLSSHLLAGNLSSLKATPNGILMGSGLARKLNLKPGDRVSVTTPDGARFSLKVVGIFQLGLGTLDNVRSYANLSAVQKLLQVDPSYITDINVKLHNNQDAKDLAKSWSKEFSCSADDWETANATFLTGNIIRNVITYAVSLTLLLVAGFGIYNILNMTIHNKMKDIAILKAIGYTPIDVRNIFMLQSIAIGLLGSLLGLVLGFILSWLISLAPFDGGDVVSLDHFPVNFSIKYYGIGMVFGVVTTAVAGLTPSRKAGNVDPIEIIRGQ